MSDEASGQGQAPTTPEGQAPTTTEGQAPTASANQTDPAALAAEKARLEAEVRELRAENAKRRKAMAEAEAKLSEAERANVEAERAKAEAQQLREQLTATSLRAEVAARAGTLRIVDTDAALALMDRGKVQFGDDGMPVGDSVQAALEALVAAKPYLAPEATPAPPSGGPPANPARGPQGAPAESLDAKRARIYGGTPQTGNPLLDPEAAKAAGGGVVFIPPVNKG